LTRREMIDELVERLESELDELTNAQLNGLITEYEHLPILTGVVDGLGEVEDEADEDDDKDDDAEELPLIDGDWDDDETEEDED
jgi:hypothetical protein